MAEQIVELAPGESKVVSFEAIPTKPKIYDVSINGLSGNFTAIHHLLAPTGEELDFEPIRVKAGEPFYPIQKLVLSRCGSMDGYRIRTTIEGAKYRYFRISTSFSWELHKYIREIIWEEKPTTKYNTQIDFAPYWFFTADDYGKMGYGSPEYEPFTCGEINIEGVPKILFADWNDGEDYAYFEPGELDGVKYTRSGTFHDGEGRPHEWVMAVWPVIIPSPGEYKVYSTLLYDKWGGTNCRNSYIYGEEDVPWRNQLVAMIEVV